MARLVATTILLVLCSFSALAFSSGQAADDATCNWLNEGVNAVCKEAGQFSDRCTSVGQLATERGCRGDAPTHADVGEDISAAHTYMSGRRRQVHRRRRRTITDAPAWYRPYCDVGPGWPGMIMPDDTAYLINVVNGATSVEVKTDGTIVKSREMLLLRKLNDTNVNKDTPFLTSRESANEIYNFDNSTANGKSKCTCYNGKITDGKCSSSGTPHWLPLTTECGGKKSAVSCPAFRSLTPNLCCLFLNSAHFKLADRCKKISQTRKGRGGCKGMMEKAERAEFMHKIKAKLTKTLKPRPCKSLLNFPSKKGCVTYEVTKTCVFDFGPYPHPKFKVADMVTADTNAGLKVECAAL